jgi:hypothetical protein
MGCQFYGSRRGSHRRRPHCAVKHPHQRRWVTGTHTACEQFWRFRRDHWTRHRWHSHLLWQFRDHTRDHTEPDLQRSDRNHNSPRRPGTERRSELYRHARARPFSQPLPALHDRQPLDQLLLRSHFVSFHAGRPHRGNRRHIFLLPDELLLLFERHRRVRVPGHRIGGCGWRFHHRGLRLSHRCQSALDGRPCWAPAKQRNRLRRGE